MKINCATSSRSVMLFIQRRTVEEALSGGAGLRSSGFGGTGGLRGGAGAGARGHS